MDEDEKRVRGRAADSRELVLRRDIDARPNLVGAAWDDPEKRKRWWAGDAADVTVTCERDRRGRAQLTIRAVFPTPEERHLAWSRGTLRAWAHSVDRLQALLDEERTQPALG